MNKVIISLSFFLFLQNGIIFSISNQVPVNKSTDTTVAEYHVKSALKLLTSNQDSARQHFRIARHIYSNLKKNAKLAYLDKLMGISYAMQGNTDSAGLYMTKSLEYYQSIKDSLHIAFSYNNLGLMYIQNGKHKKGMEYLILSLKIKSKLKNRHENSKLKIGATQENIGIAFQYLKNFNKAKEYYNMARETCQTEADSSSMYKIDIQLAGLYLDMDVFDTAQILYEKLLEPSNNDKNKYAQAKIYNNYGNLLTVTQKYDKAKVILEKAYEINKSLNNYSSMVKNLNNLAEVYQNTGNYQKALIFAEKSYKISKDNDYLVSEKHASEVLSELYFTKKDFKNAYKYLNNASMINDTLFGIERNKIIHELETKYKTKEKEQEIVLQNLKIERITIFWIASLIVIILILVLTVILIRQNKQKTKINKILEAKNKELRTLIATKDKFFALISHDLKNPLSAFGTIAEQLDTHFESIEADEIHSYIKELSMSSKQINNLLANLLHWAAIQNNRIIFKAETANLHTIVDENIKLLKNNANSKKISVINNIDDNLSASSDIKLINVVIRNLLSNAIKYNKENGGITFDAAKNNGNIHLTVEDTGIGMRQEDIPKLFRIDVDTKTIGNSPEKGTGLGLILVKEMLDKCNADIRVESKEGVGSKFIIDLPY